MSVNIPSNEHTSCSDNSDSDSINTSGDRDKIDLGNVGCTMDDDSFSSDKPDKMLRKRKFTKFKKSECLESDTDNDDNCIEKKKIKPDAMKNDFGDDNEEFYQNQVGDRKVARLFDQQFEVSRNVNQMRTLIENLYFYTRKVVII